VTLWSIDTLSDATLWDAAERAAPFLAAEYVLELNPQVSTPTAEWNTWAAHQAVTSVTPRLADDMGKPPDTATEAFHAFALDIRPEGRDGWVGRLRTVAVFVTLARATPGQAWRVTSVTAV
jgi:hypothetical protein